MDNLDAFIPFAAAEVAAKKIEPKLTDDYRKALLLWKAYLKRMRPVPNPVLINAVAAFKAVAVLSRVEFDSVKVEQLTMDKLGDLVWDQLDETARRAWLLKAV